MKNSYFAELTLHLRREGLTALPPEDGLLPVDLEGRRLCRITPSGGVRYQETDIAGEVRNAVLDRVVEIAGSTTEYMYIAALEGTGQDRRQQVAAVRDLLEDMVCHRLWGGMSNGLDAARDTADRALLHMTARMPIRFTRVLLGGEAGPHWASGFVPGAVTDTEAVKQTDIYAKAVQTYPEITEWPAICTVYVGRGLDCAWGTTDACAFDLEIMNSAGDRFLDQRGIRWVGGPYQMTVPAVPEMTAQEEQDPPQMGLTM